MKQILLSLSLVLWAATASSAPLQFSSASYSTDALAIAGVALDQHSDVSPSSPLPLLTSAAAISGAESASSAGTADTGFLATFAEASSDVDNGSGLASAEFLGLFSGTGAPIGLRLSYDSGSAGSGTAESHLLVTFNALNLFDDFISGPGFFESLLDLAVGIDGVLDILLTSSADANGGTSAYNIASVQFAANVPETPTLALLLAGMAILGASRRSPRRKAVAGR